MRFSWLKRRMIFSRVAGAVLIASLIAGPAAADTGSVVRSILLPGAGQAHQGHYTKATLFATAAVVSWVGLFSTQINYNRAVERYDSEKAMYLGYPAELNGGTELPYSTITGTRSNMEEAWQSSEDRLIWRNTFAVALGLTYALNIVDIIMSRPDTGEISETSGLSVQSNGRDVMLVKSFNF